MAVIVFSVFQVLNGSIMDTRKWKSEEFWRNDLDRWVRPFELHWEGSEISAWDLELRIL